MKLTLAENSCAHLTGSSRFAGHWWAFSVKSKSNLAVYLESTGRALEDRFYILALPRTVRGPSQTAAAVDLSPAGRSSPSSACLQVM